MSADWIWTKQVIGEERKIHIHIVRRLSISVISLFVFDSRKISFMGEIDETRNWIFHQGYSSTMSHPVKTSHFIGQNFFSSHNSNGEEKTYILTHRVLSSTLHMRFIETKYSCCFLSKRALLPTEHEELLGRNRVYTNKLANKRIFNAVEFFFFE